MGIIWVQIRSDKVGEGGAQPFRDLSLLFMSLFQGGGRAIMDNVTKILQLFFEVVPYVFV